MTPINNNQMSEQLAGKKEECIHFMVWQCFHGYSVHRCNHCDYIDMEKTFEDYIKREDLDTLISHERAEGVKELKKWVLDQYPTPQVYKRNFGGDVVRKIEEYLKVSECTHKLISAKNDDIEDGYFCKICGKLFTDKEAEEYIQSIKDNERVK